MQQNGWHKSPHKLYLKITCLQCLQKCKWNVIKLYLITTEWSLESLAGRKTKTHFLRDRESHNFRQPTHPGCTGGYVWYGEVKLGWPIDCCPGTIMPGFCWPITCPPMNTGWTWYPGNPAKKVLTFYLVCIIFTSYPS